MSYLATPQHPFRQAIAAVSGRKPPKFVRGYSSDDLSDAECTSLIEWLLSPHESRKLDVWTTGIGLLEAAEWIVKCAVENGNIPPQAK